MAEIKHSPDLKLSIAVAKSRKETSWKNTNITWSSLAKKLATTHYTHETVEQYAKMKKDDQDQIKDVGGFVGGHLKEGRRRNGHVVNRSFITLDVDFATKDLWDDIELITDYAMVAYSTHKHRPNKPRYRLIIPLAEPVSAEAYEAIARKIADGIGMDYFDDTTYQPARLFYWPSTSKDGEYFYRVIDAPVLDPNAVLALYEDWRDTSYWPESSRADSTRKKTADKQGDPLEKDGLIGSFCRTYTIQEAIEKFLPDAYQESTTPGRYTYTGGSTASGLVVYDDKFAYSNHGTDPISGQLCNAFDLVRIHKFAELDKEAKEDTPINRLPSWQKMIDLVVNDDETKKTIGAERLELAAQEFGDVDLLDDNAEIDTEWITKLETNKHGAYVETIDNMLIILRNDPNIKNMVAKNLFNQRLEVKIKNTPWQRNGDFWNDTDDAGLRHYIEKVYGLQGRQKLIDAFSLVAEEHAYHPVRDYLNSLKWDGAKRLETLFIDYLGSDDSEYTRTITRKTLVAAVARIFNPGCKFDQMLTIVGTQGLGKSYIIKKLAGPWFSDSLPDIKGKEAYEALDGVWIMEMGELAALRKSEREAIKSYISKQEDTFRRAFARNTTVSKRQCIFIGTTNDNEFLNDPTGGRRFWVLDTNEEKRIKTVWDDLNQSEIDQIWAEAVYYFRKGENIMELPPLVQKRATEMQEEHSQHNAYIGLIQEYLKIPIPKEGWDDKSLYEKRQWIQATDDFRAEDQELIYRDKVCAAEVWNEMLAKDIANMKPLDGRQINEALDTFRNWEKVRHPLRFGAYGSQRGYRRK